ncbi:unnamed protein product [Cuscuta campestris]|uniref:Aminotransferase-like plant mobile domain-containing protein n=1 Tax=Cuscuta campestris TaxID=132261 RepID=A0A484KPP0_9ASTE|nr:unnamed protein product [Cuscuta campestris]
MFKTGLIRAPPLPEDLQLLLFFNGVLPPLMVFLNSIEDTERAKNGSGLDPCFGKDSGGGGARTGGFGLGAEPVDLLLDRNCSDRARPFPVDLLRRNFQKCFTGVPAYSSSGSGFADKSSFSIFLLWSALADADDGCLGAAPAAFLIWTGRILPSAKISSAGDTSWTNPARKSKSKVGSKRKGSAGRHRRWSSTGTASDSRRSWEKEILGLEKELSEHKTTAMASKEMGTEEKSFISTVSNSGRRSPEKKATADLPLALLLKKMDLQRTQVHPGPIERDVLVLGVGEHRCDKDVEVLLGLPVDGTLVIGSVERSKENWVQMCEDMMGFRPDLEDVSKTQIKMNAIKLITVDNHSTDMDFMHHARALMLKVMGGALFTSTTGNKAWEHIPMCRPHVLLHPDAIVGAPFGVRWVCNHHWIHSSAHSIRAYRDQLDRLQENEFIWAPYPGLRYLHAHCYAGFEVWCARVPLIYTYMVERYYPDTCSIDNLDEVANPYTLLQVVHERAVETIREARYGQMLSHRVQVPAYEPVVVPRRPDRRRDAPVRGRPPRRQRQERQSDQEIEDDDTPTILQPPFGDETSSSHAPPPRVPSDILFEDFFSQLTQENEIQEPIDQSPFLGPKLWDVSTDVGGLRGGVG